ncbi:MAG: HEAT repeat domain-containing protein [Planctomycetaceae bacterium]|jgi:HEAT repeat protein|nr:HEAT repeat domain-containing protein [Planctomycetaceae bacterium]
MDQITDAAFEDLHWDTIDQLHQMDSDELWESIFALRKSGTKRVLDRALCWAKYPDEFHRSIGVSILAQLGPDGKAYPDESTQMIRSMLPTEQSDEVITSLISAVSFREIADATPWLISLANNPSEDIRWRVAWALPIRGIENPPIYQTSIETLVKLMQDPEPRVREWATFSLSMTDEDTPAIRHALLERLSDSDFQTRSEAAIGLANRKEQAGIDLLVEHLQSDRVGELYVQAAEIYADCRLRPALLSLAKWWDVDPELLDKALVACS